MLPLLCILSLGTDYNSIFTILTLYSSQQSITTGVVEKYSNSCKTINHSFHLPPIFSGIPTKSSAFKQGLLSGNFTISLNSLTVNATCRGPRLPTRNTRLMVLCRMASKACSVMSVFCESKTTTLFIMNKYRTPILLIKHKLLSNNYISQSTV